MAEKTKIEWTASADGTAGATWNPVIGCEVLSPGCKHCYAMKLAGNRMRNHPSRIGLTEPSNAGPVWNGQVRFMEAWLDQPLQWKKPRTIFAVAHGDLFFGGVTDASIDRIFGVMAKAQHHHFIVLTKRSKRMRAYASDADTPMRVMQAAGLAEPPTWPLPNVTLMVSAERQREADERIPDLLATPAARRGVSLEPLLGPIDLTRVGSDFGPDGVVNALTGTWAALPVRSYGGRPWIQIAPSTRLDWVIVGGESGANARPMHSDWLRGLRDQCVAASVAFFFKQWGEYVEIDGTRCQDNGHSRLSEGVPKWWVKLDGTLIPRDDSVASRHCSVWGTDSLVIRPGKAAAGAILDGRQWRELPR